VCYLVAATTPHYQAVRAWEKDTVVMSFLPRITMETLTRKKTIASVMSEVEDTDGGAHALKRCLSRWDIVAYGISTTVGAGLFVITGTNSSAIDLFEPRGGLLVC
jgi:amino acid permease